MSSVNLFDRVVSLMEDRLNINSRRQELLASNIANLDTPGYVAKDLSFEKTLQEAMKPRIQMVKTDSRHMAIPDPEDVVKQVARKPDVEKTGPVDLETEMEKLARNNLEYQFIVTMLNKKFALLKMVLMEEGR